MSVIAPEYEDLKRDPVAAPLIRVLQKVSELKGLVAYEENIYQDVGAIKDFADRATQLSEDLHLFLLNVVEVPIPDDGFLTGGWMNSRESEKKKKEKRKKQQDCTINKQSLRFLRNSAQWTPEKDRELRKKINKSCSLTGCIPDEQYTVATL